MIVEVVDLHIKDGTEADFEAAFAKAADEIFRKAKGCRGMHLERCVEEPALYRGIISWETLEDHTVGFRGSPLFQEWRNLVGGFFSQPPSATHYVSAVPHIDY